MTARRLAGLFITLAVVAAVALATLLYGEPTASAQTAPTITISAPASVPEGDPAVFTITASSAPGSNLTVNLQQVVKNNCATVECGAGATTTPTAIISANQLSVDYTVQTENDNKDEYDGSVKVTVLPAAGSQYNVGSPDTATVTVADEEEPALQFSEAGYRGSEGATAGFVVSISPGSYKTVTVDYRPFALTTSEDAFAFATVGMDYATDAVSGTVTFKNHVAVSASTEFSLIDDELDEVGEEFGIELHNPVNAVLGDRTTTSYGILDNDPAVPQLVPDLYPAGAGALTVEWAASETAANAFTGYNVQYRLAAGVMDDDTPAWTNGPQNVAGLSADITGLDAGVEYQARVRPQRLEGDSPWSAIGTGTVSAYDLDNDNLIEIATLAQLNAVRWDVDGNGEVADANQANYTDAFPGAAAGMICAACIGYELTAGLDFDTDGSGAANAGDTYWNGGNGWAPIYGFTAEFNGNGHGISNLFIDRGGSNIALFGTTNGAYIHHLGLIDVNIVQRNSDAQGTAPLVGSATRGTIAAVFATGSVTGGLYVTGLVGETSGNLLASWSDVVVQGGNNDDEQIRVAGLSSVNQTDGGKALASYAVGETRNSPNYFGTHYGAILGSSLSSLTTVYYDNIRNSERTIDSTLGRTTAQLQSPTGYTGLYAAWNVDLDNADSDNNPLTGGDSPWDFGTSADYPALKADRNNDGIFTVAEFPGQHTRTPQDYDADDDNLIDVDSLFKLDALRWDPDGDGAVTAGDQANYTAGFPNPVAGMGCPATCAGYELTDDLDFDTNGDGAVDAQDLFWNGGAAGTPSTATPPSSAATAAASSTCSSTGTPTPSGCSVA